MSKVIQGHLPMDLMMMVMMMMMPTHCPAGTTCCDAKAAVLPIIIDCKNIVTSLWSVSTAGQRRLFFSAPFASSLRDPGRRKVGRQGEWICAVFWGAFHWNSCVENPAAMNSINKRVRGLRSARGASIGPRLAPSLSESHQTWGQLIFLH